MTETRPPYEPPAVIHEGPAGRAGPVRLRTGALLQQPPELYAQQLQLIPEERTTDRREYWCSFMAAGRVKHVDQSPSDWIIPAATIATQARLFEARPVYLDHVEGSIFGPPAVPQVKNLVGVTFKPVWDNDAQAVVGGLRLYDRDPGSPGRVVGTLLDQILEDRANGLEIPPIGLSAVFYHLSHLDEEKGLRITDEIKYIESVDIVYDPGAAGYIRQALSALPKTREVHGLYPAAEVPKGEDPMSEDVQTQDPQPDREARADLHAEQQAGAALLSRLNSLESQIDRLTAALADRAEQNAISDVGTPAVRQMRSGVDRISLALDAMLDGVRPPSDIAPLSGIRELYTHLSGDYEMTGRFHEDRVMLAAVTSSTMANLVADALNKRVVNMFQSYPQWWAPAVTIEDFSTLQDIQWITLGGVGELPTVAEGQAYSELTWDDNVETASFVKKGGYLGLTIEAIDKDDTRRLQAAPRALAQAAWMTLGKAIAEIFTDNSGAGPALSDGTYLFAVARGNLGTTAFSASEWDAVKILMMKYEELNSGEPMGALTKPALLWVPVDLEADAISVLATGEGLVGSQNYDVNPDAYANELMGRISGARQRVISCPFWTDTNNWAAQADPRLYPGIGLGFRYGHSPEIFSVASPTAGLMFSNDTMPIKARFFFAVGPTDWRAFYKENVA